MTCSFRTANDTVALTALIRATVVTATHRVEEGDRGPQVCSELLRAAYWREARDGWTGNGIDVLTGTLKPFADQAAQLVAYVRPVLEEYGDLDLVKAFLARLKVRGSGAPPAQMRPGAVLPV
ncbi:hypothetical protein [Streptomyces flavidovirens]|uniref:hypothetical protein n=1 Tax=Streptomyces flavidovirens TaxID=67298 RepID=UPI003677597E